MKRTPLPARTSPLRRTTRLAPVSARRTREQRVYTRLRAAFLAEHERCQFPGGCAQPATDLHHKRGRVGRDFTDPAHFAALCRPHHDWLGAHPQAAYEMGMSERRIGGAA